MRFLCVLTLYAFGASAAALSPRQELVSFPDMSVSYNGYECYEYSSRDISDIPFECVYHVVCNIMSADAFERCFEEGNEPKGIVNLDEFYSFPYYCKQQAICGYPASVEISEFEEPESEVEPMASWEDISDENIFDDNGRVVATSDKSYKPTFEGDLGKFPPKKYVPPLFVDISELHSESSSEEEKSKDNGRVVATSDKSYKPTFEGDLGKFPPKKYVPPLFVDISELHSENSFD